MHIEYTVQCQFLKVIVAMCHTMLGIHNYCVPQQAMYSTEKMMMGEQVMKKHKYRTLINTWEKWQIPKVGVRSGFAEGGRRLFLNSR